MSGPTPPASFSSTTSPSSESTPTLPEPQNVVEQPKFFFREKYAKLGVKGNFMPLAAQPVNVDLADWLAHQSVCIVQLLLFSWCADVFPRSG